MVYKQQKHFLVWGYEIQDQSRISVWGGPDLWFTDGVLFHSEENKTTLQGFFFFLNKDTICIHEGSFLMTSFAPKGLTSQPLTLVLKFQHVNIGFFWRELH